MNVLQRTLHRLAWVFGFGRSPNDEKEFFKTLETMERIYGPGAHKIALRLTLLDLKNKGLVPDYASIRVAFETALKTPFREPGETSPNDDALMM